MKNRILLLALVVLLVGCSSESPRKSVVMPTPRPSPPIRVLSLNVVDKVSGGKTWVVAGEVRNDGSVAARLVDVNVTLYNSNGGVVDTAHDYADPHPIAPGGTATFKVWLDDVARVGTRVTAIARAE